MDTRCPAAREETDCLHYANAAQLELTVAKNRCRYRGMLTRTSREFLPFPLSGPFWTLSPSSFRFSSFRQALRLCLDSEDSPAQSWDEMVLRAKIGSLFPHPCFAPLKNFPSSSPSPLFPCIFLFLDVRVFALASARAKDALISLAFAGEQNGWEGNFSFQKLTVLQQLKLAVLKR